MPPDGRKASGFPDTAFFSLSERLRLEEDRGIAPVI
jgi:hypothetical protein